MKIDQASSEVNQIASSILKPDVILVQKVGTKILNILEKICKVKNIRKTSNRFSKYLIKTKTIENVPLLQHKVYLKFHRTW